MDKQLEEFHKLAMDYANAEYLVSEESHDPSVAKEALKKLTDYHLKITEAAERVGYIDGCSNPNYHDGVHDEQARIVEMLEGEKAKVAYSTPAEYDEEKEAVASIHNTALTQAIAKIKEMR